MPERGLDDNLEAARPLLAAHFTASLGLISEKWLNVLEKF